jgi:hypothetical protein
MCRIIEQGVKSKKTEEKKEKNFDGLFHHIPLPNFHAIPLETLLRAFSPSTAITG